MLNKKRVIALIPARAGSKGFKNKNLALLKEIPLVAWPINAAKKSKYISSVYLTTDSDEIAQAGIKYGAKVPWLRPEELASDTATRSAVILHAIKNLEDFDYLVYLEPTSPLTTESDIDNALETLFNSKDANSLVSICKHSTKHPIYAVKTDQRNIISPYNNLSFEDIPTNRQDLEDSYFFDGSLYISSKKSFIKNEEFITNETIGYEVDEEKALEVDTPLDLELIKLVLENNEKKL